MNKAQARRQKRNSGKHLRYAQQDRLYSNVVRRITKQIKRSIGKDGEPKDLCAVEALKRLRKTGTYTKR